MSRRLESPESPMLVSPEPGSGRLPADLLARRRTESDRPAAPEVAAASGPVRVMRRKEWASPPVPVHREVISELPSEDTGKPPLLFVPGLRHGAWCFSEHWLGHAAERGFPAYAMSLRGHGGSGGAQLRRRTTLTDYVHDVMQVAASLPRRAVLIGHGVGGLVVAQALARYPAHAGVLLAPVVRGWRTLGAALLRHPLGTVPGLFGFSVGLRPRQLYGRGLPKGVARHYRSRLDRSAPRVQYQLLMRRRTEPVVPGTPVLVVGSPQDRLVSQGALRKVAASYGTEPLMFPGMAHHLMLDARWAEPLDAVLDWLSETVD